MALGPGVQPEVDDFTSEYEKLAAGETPSDSPAQDQVAAERQAPLEDDPALEGEAVLSDAGGAGDEPGETTPAEEQPLSPEEEAEQERQQFLANKRELERQERDYQRRYGKPVLSPEEQQAQDRARQAVADVRETMPEVDQAVEHQISQRLDEVAEEFRGEMTQAQNEASEEIHHSAILAQHPDWGEIRQNKAAVEQWIGQLPYAEGQQFMEVVQNGNADEIINLVDRFKDDMGIDDISELYQPRQGRQATNDPDDDDAAAASALPSRGMRRAPGSEGGQGEDEFTSEYNRLVAEEQETQRRAG